MAIMAETVKGSSYQTCLQDGGIDVPGPGAASVVGRMAGFIYHDLRHPLTAILAYSELLAEDDLDRLQRKDFHQEIRLAVSRMNDLISLLMELSKGPEAVRPEVADIVETVKRGIQVVAVRPEFRRIMIRYHHDGLTEGCFGLRGLQGVITNIVLNACEAVPADSGRVQVTSVGRHDCLEIRVSDNGPGIPAPIRNAVFQPFVSYGKEGGTGLGLAIVQKILRDHGGEIYLDFTGEKGTLFRLVLPYANVSPESLEMGARSDRFTLAPVTRTGSHPRSSR
ncbi:MAG TPA: HAMP domain-containing sensor histidine kinase [Terriglobia bacterium]|nr:HAMP domain-containing sensor histidine kinase [Terriglobia bacterium]